MPATFCPGSRGSSHRTSVITRTTAARPNGHSDTGSSIPPRSSAMPSAHSGLAGTRSVSRAPLWRASRTRTVRSRARAASISLPRTAVGDPQPPTATGTAASSGIRRRSSIMGSAMATLRARRLGGGTTLRTSRIPFHSLEAR